MKLIIGEKYLVFDGGNWAKKGDIGDNSCFYKPATIILLYIIDNEPVADVKFAHSNSISKGHFQDGILPLTQ